MTIKEESETEPMCDVRMRVARDIARALSALVDSFIRTSQLPLKEALTCSVESLSLTLAGAQLNASVNLGAPMRDLEATGEVARLASLHDYVSSHQQSCPCELMQEVANYIADARARMVGVPVGATYGVSEPTGVEEEEEEEEKEEEEEEEPQLAREAAQRFLTAVKTSSTEEVDDEPLAKVEEIQPDRLPN